MVDIFILSENGHIYTHTNTQKSNDCLKIVTIWFGKCMCRENLQISVFKNHSYMWSIMMSEGRKFMFYERSVLNSHQPFLIRKSCFYMYIHNECIIIAFGIFSFFGLMNDDGQITYVIIATNILHPQKHKWRLKVIYLITRIIYCMSPTTKTIPNTSSYSLSFNISILRIIYLSLIDIKTQVIYEWINSSW